MVVVGAAVSAGVLRGLAVGLDLILSGVMMAVGTNQPGTAVILLQFPAD